MLNINTNYNFLGITMTETEVSALPPVEITAPAEALPPALQQKAQDLAQTIKLDDPTLTVTYGTDTMKEIAGFADNLLGRVRAKDAGPVGDALTELVLKVKGLDLEKLSKGEKSFLERIPFIGQFFNSLNRQLTSFKTMTDQVEVISHKLEEAMVGLLRDVAMLEELYKHNQTSHQSLSMYIEAGRARLAKARDEELPKLQEEAKASSDTLAAQKVRDFAESINRFERRLHDLQLSRTITLQTAPQIRLIQSNNQTLAEKIQTSILATIPIWKSQMVLALSLHGQRSAAKLQREVADTTNQLLEKNAEMLESATLETAREVERSVVDIQTLRNVHGKLLSTIEETLRIAQEGRAQRISVEKELVVMEHDLKDRLTALAARKAEDSLNAAEGQKSLEAPEDAGSASTGA